MNRVILNSDLHLHICTKHYVGGMCKICPIVRAVNESLVACMGSLRSHNIQEVWISS